jgi:hypothetical protein
MGAIGGAVTVAGLAGLFNALQGDATKPKTVGYGAAIGGLLGAAASWWWY